MAGIVLDENFTHHKQDQEHPEKPERVIAIRDALRTDNLLDTCLRLPVQSADLKLLELNHSRRYIEEFRQACRSDADLILFNGDFICPESFEVARQAAGSVAYAADAIMSGACKTAFCAVRPPGHHAAYDQSRGFCYFNNVALAARHLLDAHQLERILIFDWDVHHGDGTQRTFYSDPRVLFCSVHVDPRFIYPRVSGFANEQGDGSAKGTNLNIPLRPGDGETEYKDAFMGAFLPIAKDFNPDFVLISAGFDGHRDDPLGKLKLTEETYAWLTRQLVALANECAKGRVLSVLEGGYKADALGRSVRAHVEQLVVNERK